MCYRAQFLGALGNTNTRKKVTSSLFPAIFHGGALKI